MFEWIYGQGWGEERKQAHRIEKLLEEEVKLLRQILQKVSPAEFRPTTGIKVTKTG
jgi:hypothetical protein